MGFFANKYTSFVLSFFKYACLICLLPPFLNYAALNREKSVLFEHGLPYDIGLGQKLFLSCKGRGAPTIIAESPLGLSSDLWIPLQEKLATLTRVCVYDRAGLGGMSDRSSDQATNNKSSEEASKTKARVNRGMAFTVERMADDLRKLITTSSQQERPLILVGAELGALIARFYAQIYEDNISHLILLNPMVESLLDTNDGIWKHYWYEHIVPKWYSYAVGSTLGLNRLFLMSNLIHTHLNTTTHSNEAVALRQKHSMCNPKHLYSMVDEFSHLNETLVQMKLAWNIKQFPQNTSVTIFSSRKDSMFTLDEKVSNAEQLKLNEEWAKSVDYLKNSLHPRANKIDLDDESIYELLMRDPQFLYVYMRDLILEWRSLNLISTKTS